MIDDLLLACLPSRNQNFNPLLIARCFKLEPSKYFKLEASKIIPDFDM